MSTDRDILLKIKADNAGRLLAAVYLADIAIITVDQGMTEAEIQKKLQTVAGRSGKVGVCILVQRPIAVPESDNTAGRSQIIQAFTVIEHPTINASSQGTGKRAEEVAAEVYDLFQNAASSIPGQVWSGYAGGAIVPDEGFQGLNAWEVRMQMFAGLRRVERAGTPLIDPDEGAAPQLVTITGATAGASIYYTLDGSYPSSANAAATLYAGPINVAAAATLRASAEAAGYQQSNVSEATFS